MAGSFYSGASFYRDMSMLPYTPRIDDNFGDTFMIDPNLEAATTTHSFTEPWHPYLHNNNNNNHLYNAMQSRSTGAATPVQFHRHPSPMSAHSPPPETESSCDHPATPPDTMYSPFIPPLTLDSTFPVMQGAHEFGHMGQGVGMGGFVNLGDINPPQHQDCLETDQGFSDLKLPFRQQFSYDSYPASHCELEMVATSGNNTMTTSHRLATPDDIPSVRQEIEAAAAVASSQYPLPPRRSDTSDLSSSSDEDNISLPRSTRRARDSSDEDKDYQPNKRSRPNHTNSRRTNSSRTTTSSSSSSSASAARFPTSAPNNNHNRNHNRRRLTSNRPSPPSSSVITTTAQQQLPPTSSSSSSQPPRSLPPSSSLSSSSLAKFICPDPSCSRSSSSSATSSAAPYYFSSQSDLDAHTKKQHTRPFICVFHFAGCASTFASKNEWKRHVTTQHLLLTYWLCTEGACANLPAGKSAIFNRKDLYTQHLKRMHCPAQLKKSLLASSSSTTKNGGGNNNNNKENKEWEEKLKAMQARGVRERCKLPERMECPVAGCRVGPFEGRDAWDMRMEHVARHLEGKKDSSSSSSPSTTATTNVVVLGGGEKVEFGGERDQTLISWAGADSVGIIVRRPSGDGWELKKPLDRQGCSVAANLNNNNAGRGGVGGVVIVGGGGGVGKSIKVKQEPQYEEEEEEEKVVFVKPEYQEYDEVEDYEEDEEEEEDAEGEAD